MALLLSDLFTPLTRDEVLASMLDVAKDLGLPATSWQSGSVARTVLVVIAQKISDFTQTTSLIAKGGLLDYATGKWLRILAKSCYGVDYIPASFAGGKVTLTNTSLVSYTIATDDLTFANSVTGKTYKNVAGGVLAPSGGTLTLDLLADEVGTGSNANAGEVSVMVTPLSGVTCTNVDPVIGLDDETDENLRQRCRDKLAALSPNGAAAAYSFFAKSATRADGTAIGVTRVKTLGDSSISQVIVYIATATGTVAGGDVTTINTLLQTKVVPTGTTMTLISANAHSIQIVATVYVAKESTLTSTQVKQAVLAKLNAYFSTIPIGGFDIGGGGKVFLDAVIGQIYQAASNIVQVTIALPVSDVAMSVNDVAECSSVSGDITVVQLA